MASSKFRIKHSKKAPQNFMIEFNKNFTSDAHTPLTYKRVIFVSCIGLFQTYDKCPPYILNSALLIMPLQKKWVYSPSKYIQNIRSVSCGLIKNDSRARHFFELLRYKDAQGLVLWASDHYDQSSNYSESMMHPFWQNVSRTLISLYDPISCKHYESIPDPVDCETFWNAKIKALSVHNNYTANGIMSELYFKSLQFEYMKMIFNTSNPGSFHVITQYTDDVCDAGKQIVFIRMQLVNHESCDDEWWISTDYFD